MMVAGRQADACLQAGGGPWDFAALALIVEEAGGRFSDLDGGWRIECGGPRLFSNGVLHGHALAAVAGGGGIEAEG